MTAVSEVTVCNLALGWLGANPIISLEDESVEAQLCKSNYDTSRDAALEARDWTFASTRKALTPLAETPPFGYEYQFTLPADCVRTMQISDEPDFDHEFDYVKEKKNILADAELIYIRYIWRVEDPQMFSPGFVQAFAARLAADIAIPITNSPQVQANMVSLYLAKIETAGVMDGLQGKNIKLRARKLVRVR